jgi:hypothetical protein
MWTEQFPETPLLTGLLARHCIVGFVVRDRAALMQNLMSRPELCANTLLPSHPRDNQGFKDVLVRGQDHMLQKKVLHSRSQLNRFGDVSPVGSFPYRASDLQFLHGEK